MADPLDPEAFKAAARGKPKVRVRYTRVEITHAGQRWTGRWYMEGDELCVESAWGSGQKPLRGREPDEVARRILLDVVKARQRDGDRDD